MSTLEKKQEKKKDISIRKVSSLSKKSHPATWILFTDDVTVKVHVAPSAREENLYFRQQESGNA